MRAEYQANNFIFQLPTAEEETKSNSILREANSITSKMSLSLNADEMPDLIELLVFADLVLMQKLRNHCSSDFLKMIDQAILSELDQVNDLQIEN